ncbi:MAG: hypothetical protein LBH19_15280 [Dysgonamonadaceae bacterium]|jgi:hypothetical protein|nr:hypothetical protein [Dysgonamonadaceae bacterium]
MEAKEELYKIRTIGERFSATSDFVRENWKVLLRNLLPVGLILALLMGFFIQYYMQTMYAIIENSMDFASVNWLAYTGMTIVSMLFSFFIYSMSGAILNRSAEGLLTPETGWADLKGTFFSIAGRLFIQYCIIFLFFLVFAVIVAVPTALLISGNLWMATSVLLTFVFLLFLAAVVVFLPAFSLMQYPVYFELSSAWKSIKKGFKWGFRYWGSTFLTSLLGILIVGVVVYILAMPCIVYMMFGRGNVGWLGSLLFAFMYAGILFLTPLYIIFLAFQYTSIAEREKSKFPQEAPVESAKI